MTHDEIVAKLRSIARAFEYDARNCEASAREHRPEYERLLFNPAPDVTPEIHERILELYPHVITMEHNAKRWREDIAALREAAEIIEEQNRHG